MVKFDVFGLPTEPPPGTKVLKKGTVCQGMYRDGVLVKCKVQIVVKGFSQIPRLHFNETYTPVIKWETFRLILAIGTWLGLAIHQFDMKSAYLHGTMKEEVWVQQPEGFEVPRKEHLPMRLQKALYGIKLGGYKWNRTLYRFMEVEQGWTGYTSAKPKKSYLHR
jgi:hypothetical protein